MRRRRAVAVACIVGVVVAFGAVTAEAALTTTKCLAAKTRAAASLRKCRTDVEAKLLEGKTADPAKCEITFRGKLAKLDAKAAKAGIECRFRDNGDGTVTDYDTGLLWEKKNSRDGVKYFPNPHDVENVYAWSASVANLADGEVFTEFLGRLNGSTNNPFDIDPCVYSDLAHRVIGGFAGHCDWRLPTREELLTIPDFTVLGANTSASHGYLSSSTQATDLSFVWYVHGSAGSAATQTKTSGNLAVGVRGGW